LLLDAAGNLKISDFGMARLYVGDPDADGDVRAELLHTTCGTPNYVAPEVLTCKGYDGHMADIWSMGVILYVLLAGYLPFEEATTAALFKKIKNADYTYPSWFEQSALDVLQRILVVDPKIRINMTEFRNSEFISNPDCPTTPPFPLVPVPPTAAQTNSSSAAPEESARREKKKSHLSNTHVPEPPPLSVPPPRPANSDDEGTPHQKLLPLTVDHDHEEAEASGDGATGATFVKTAEAPSPGMLECICNPFSKVSVAENKP
jgi:serine/threonine protein kinase